MPSPREDVGSGRERKGRRQVLGGLSGGGHAPPSRAASLSKRDIGLRTFHRVGDAEAFLILCSLFSLCWKDFR